ncbi:MAG: hypothetical protein WKF71_02660 [Pyrinomonadaceae bacterium]
MILDTNTNSQFVKRVLITVAIVAAFVLIIWAFVYVVDVILLLFGAILLAIFLHGLANIVRRYLQMSEGYFGFGRFGTPRCRHCFERLATCTIGYRTSPAAARGFTGIGAEGQCVSIELWLGQVYSRTDAERRGG